MGDLERDLDFDFKGLRFRLSRSAILENVHVMINFGSRPHGYITAASLKSAGYTGCTHRLRCCHGYGLKEKMEEKVA